MSIKSTILIAFYTFAGFLITSCEVESVASENLLAIVDGTSTGSNITEDEIGVTIDGYGSINGVWNLIDLSYDSEEITGTLQASTYILEITQSTANNNLTFTDIGGEFAIEGQRETFSTVDRIIGFRTAFSGGVLRARTSGLISTGRTEPSTTLLGVSNLTENFLVLNITGNSTNHVYTFQKNVVESVTLAETTALQSVVETQAKADEIAALIADLDTSLIDAETLDTEALQAITPLLNAVTETELTAAITNAVTAASNAGRGAILIRSDAVEITATAAEATNIAAAATAAANIAGTETAVTAAATATATAAAASVAEAAVAGKIATLGGIVSADVASAAAETAAAIATATTKIVDFNKTSISETKISAIEAAAEANAAVTPEQEDVAVTKAIAVISLAQTAETTAREAVTTANDAVITALLALETIEDAANVNGANISDIAIARARATTALATAETAAADTATVSAAITAELTEITELLGEVVAEALAAAALIDPTTEDEIDIELGENANIPGSWDLVAITSNITGDLDTSSYVLQIAQASSNNNLTFVESGNYTTDNQSGTFTTIADIVDFRNLHGGGVLRARASGVISVGRDSDRNVITRFDIVRFTKNFLVINIIADVPLTDNTYIFKRIASERIE